MLCLWYHSLLYVISYIWYHITMISYIWYHIHKLWYHRCFTACIYSIVYHTSDIVGIDYDIINTDLWYHSYMVSHVYHIKYLGCYIIGRDCDITVVMSLLFANIRISCNIMYQISYVILDVKCESQYPFVQAIKSGTALKAVLTGRRLGEEETETILMS